jgi:hypothetical protein
MSDKDIIELISQLRAMARCEHEDMTVVVDAADEIERLRAERDALKAAAREFLTTLGAAMKTGRFHMNGSADMCHFVRQAMQKLDVLAFDREERRPVGLERLHEEAKP